MHWLIRPKVATVALNFCTTQEFLWCVFFSFSPWLFSDVLNCILKHDTHNIKSTYLILCRFPLCSQNGSDLSRYGHKTSGGVLWCLAPGSSGPVCSGVRPTWIRFVLARPTGWLDWDLGDLEARLPLGLYFAFLKLFLSSFYCVSGRIVLLEGQCHWGVPMPWGGVLGPQLCLDGWCESISVHMNARTQGFPAEHCIVPRWSPVSGFNVVITVTFER